MNLNMPLALMALYGSIMIAAVLLLRLLLRDRLPRFVFPLLWAVVLVRLLIPFSISSPISAPVPAWLSETPATAEAVAAEGSWGEEGNTDVAGYSYEEPEGAASSAFTFAEQTTAFDWQKALTALFLLGAAGTAGMLLFQWRRYAKQLKDSLLLEHNDSINRILQHLGMGALSVFSSDCLVSPLVCGVLRPRIYLPTCMDFQNIPLLEHILTHEAMHVRRRDNWFKLVMLLVLCINWYNPLVWLMAKCLSADLEAACDAAVLKSFGEDGRQAYAGSLLTLAVTGSRSALMYSAFSKTEVERRIKGILKYKKATALTLTLAAAIVLCCTAVFASAGQAPFSKELSNFCSFDSNCWGISASLSRSIVLGVNSRARANRTIMETLRKDSTEDLWIIRDEAQKALAAEFRVEKSAFHIDGSLVLTDEKLAEEYDYRLTKDKNNDYFYDGELIRCYEDKDAGISHVNMKGSLDYIIIRDKRLGVIATTNAYYSSSPEFQKRSDELEELYTAEAALSPGTLEARLVQEEQSEVRATAEHKAAIDSQKQQLSTEELELQQTLIQLMEKHTRLLEEQAAALTAGEDTAEYLSELQEIESKLTELNARRDNLKEQIAALK